MEQVISIIIMIAVGAFFAWVEKLSKKNAAKADRRMAAEAKASRSRCTAPPVPEPMPRKYAPLPPLPEEGMRVTPTVAPPPKELPTATQESPDLRQWRDRWRRAIIDAEILSPKFR